MNLSEALQIRPGVTAIIGGGGKTTLMERLAHELSGKARVIVCTTTHIYRGKEPVLRHVPEEEAVDRLVELIESNIE